MRDHNMGRPFVRPKDVDMVDKKVLELLSEMKGVGAIKGPLLSWCDGLDIYLYSKIRLPIRNVSSASSCPFFARSYTPKAHNAYLSNLG